MSNLVRAGAFVLTAVFAVPLVVLTLAELVEAVGPGWGVVLVVVVVVVVAVLSYLAAVSPGTTARWLGTASRRITNEAPAALRCATADHTEIYEALVARDPAGARAAMRKHLRNNSTLLAEKARRTKRAARRR